MTIELTMLAFSIVLGLVQLVLAAQAKNRQHGYVGSLPARRAETASCRHSGTTDRAFVNFQETFPFFAAAVLMAQLAGRHDWMTVWGSVAYLAARVV